VKVVPKVADAAPGTFDTIFTQICTILDYFSPSIFDFWAKTGFKADEEERVATVAYVP